MTVWDTIYKNYQNGGEARATLKGGLITEFTDFVDKQFKKPTTVLDIGCGTGKYLVYLKNLGFDIYGIDSSPTSVAMTKEHTNSTTNISCEDMYQTNIGKNKFGMIIAIQAIHHGSKKHIQKLIQKIYDALQVDGKIFITLPEYQSSTHWNTFKDKEEIAPGTFVPLSGPEKGLAHSFFTQEETSQLFSMFHNISIHRDERGKWIITGTK